MSVYTLGLWHVKRGDEDAFVAAWKAMAMGTKEHFPEATAVLLRDRDEPQLFVSFGPWASLDQIGAWRASAVFTDGVGRIREHLDGFEPHTMDPVVTIE